MMNRPARPSLFTRRMFLPAAGALLCLGLVAQAADGQSARSVATFSKLLDARDAVRVPPDAAAARMFTQLKTENPGWRMRINPATGKLGAVSGTLTPPGSPVSDARARAFLADHADLFGIKDAQS